MLLEGRSLDGPSHDWLGSEESLAACLGRPVFRSRPAAGIPGDLGRILVLEGLGRCHEQRVGRDDGHPRRGLADGWRFVWAIPVNCKNRPHTRHQWAREQSSSSLS